MVLVILVLVVVLILLVLIIIVVVVVRILIVILVVVIKIVVIVLVIVLLLAAAILPSSKMLTVGLVVRELGGEGERVQGFTFGGRDSGFLVFLGYKSYILSF